MHRVIPARRMHRRARERCEAGNGGNVGLVEHAHGADQDVRLEVPRRGADEPRGGPFAPLRRKHVGIEMQVRPQAEPLDAVLEVCLDLGLPRVGA